MSHRPPVRSRPARVLRSAALLGALALLGTGCNWLQFGGGPDHSGVGFESTITTGNAHSLHQAWQVALPSRADGSPAYVEGVQTPSGKHDMVVVTTTAGDLMAYDAAAGGAPLWQAHHGPGTCKINNGSSTCYTTSSPAVDPNLTYVYTYGLDGKVHKHSLGDGSEVISGGWPVTVTTKGFDEKGSSALSIATAANGHSYLYAATAGYPGDRGDYQGHIVTIDLADAAGSTHVFNTLCSNQTVLFREAPATPDCPEQISGVWSRPGVTYDSKSNRIYFVTGNGRFSPSQFDWGDSMLALNADGTGGFGGPLDSYTPSNYQQLQDYDIDLGSTSPAILPTPSGSTYNHIAVLGGKDSKLRLVNLDDFSGQNGRGHLGGEIGTPVAVPQGGGVLSQPAVWVNPADKSTWVFVTTSSGTAGLRLQLAANGTPMLVTQWTRTDVGSVGSPIVVNGVLFVPSGSSLVALDPVSHATLWTGALAGGIHWQTPSSGGGRVYMEDQGGRLTAFSL